ncbi:hypothetical protein MKQ68_01665 [Chitinophaga horti]|uniref:Uncharacterized protein n=1 Tax=Chitinophaga horti TaxID=2920382 RepID=A0ABY6J2C3_9BACT|nr:hypothetical protein [Chitinophaga horti]UYQ93801.1 hypothetical protein MKQ68_01665 [Chitinophaga horti]
MKEIKHTTPFHNLLTGLVIQDNQTGQLGTDLEKEAAIVFSEAASVSLSPDKAALLLKSLAQVLSQDTLGSLVAQALTTSTAHTGELQHVTGLTPSLLEAIQADMIFTNSVPVKSLVKLLKLLQIPLERATAAIAATFEKLQTESRMFISMPAAIQPAFKKGITPVLNQSDFKHLKPDESYLYQNKEALDKYTQRLSELYQQV